MSRLPMILKAALQPGPTSSPGSALSPTVASSPSSVSMPKSSAPTSALMHGPPVPIGAKPTPAPSSPTPLTNEWLRGSMSQSSPQTMGAMAAGFAPLLKGPLSVGGLPSLAAGMDYLRGGNNMSTLLAGGANPPSS